MTTLPKRNRIVLSSSGLLESAPIGAALLTFVKVLLARECLSDSSTIDIEDSLLERRNRGDSGSEDYRDLSGGGDRSEYVTQSEVRLQFLMSMLMAMLRAEMGAGA